MRDEIRIAPADGQAAEDVADVLAQAAEAQGLDAGEITLSGDQVVVPRALATRMDSSGLTGFPPENQAYRLQGPVDLIDPENPDRPTFLVVPDN
ncbi:hypothetical protein [Streptomyces sp. NPDC017868]|uniref:hypothetical protein n=1 Tax=Streptomyces sp. NPDC017868 TaxID=3365014 RepID=UPI0037A00AB6